MSQENVELVRAAWDAWARGDMDAALSVFTPDAEWDVTRSDIPDLGVYRGPEGVLAFFRDWQEQTFDDYRAVAEEFIAAGDETVLVRVLQSGIGRLSGIPLDDDDPHAQLWHLRAGQAVRVTIYRSWPEALEAAGLGQ